MSQKRAKRKRRIPVFENEYGELIPLKTIQRIQKATDKINQQRRDKLAYYSNKYWYQQLDEENKLPKGEGGVKFTLADKLIMSKYEDYSELKPVEFHPEKLRASNAKKMVKSREFMTTKKYHNFINKRYKENLMKSVETVIGQVDPDKADLIISKLKRISADKLADLYYRGNTFDIEFYYQEYAALTHYDPNDPESVKSHDSVINRIDNLSDSILDTLDPKWRDRPKRKRKRKK